MRVAVCFSGQPRGVGPSLSSLKTYFSSADYEVDFFCHVWPYVTWKSRTNLVAMAPEMITQEQIDLIQTTFNPIRFELGKMPDPVPMDFVSGSRSMFESMALSNQLRRFHEVDSGFEYDWVIRARYDMVFPVGKHWWPPVLLQERMVCVSHMGRASYEFRKVSFSDVFFYGDSWGMDIAADTFFEKAYPHKPTIHDDSALNGPGVSLYDFLTRNNVLCLQVPSEERLIRVESKHMNPIDDWDEIERIHLSYY